MKVEFESSWANATGLVKENGNYIKKMIDDNNIEQNEFTSISIGENPYDFTCKFRGTKISKLEILLTKVRDAYPDLNQSDVKLLIMGVAVKKILAGDDRKKGIRTFENTQAFVRNELLHFHPVDCAVDMWDCEGDIPTQYKTYLATLERPWKLDYIKGAMMQELDTYNRNLPKDFSNSKISKDSFDNGFEMALAEYYHKFDKTIRERLAYDGSDPKQAIGILIDALAISGPRELQIAKIWQYCINVKRMLYPECGLKRSWHVCPTFVGKAGTGKTETALHFLVRPLMGRGTASRFTDLADPRWTPAFCKYYGIMMDDIGYDDFTTSREGTVKEMITADKKLNRDLGANSDSAFKTLILKMSLVGSSNYHIADLTKDDALLRRLVELPSEKTGNGDLTPVLHLDPDLIFKSIDESQLSYNPIMDGEVAKLWEIDKAESRQHHWIYRGLRHHGYLPKEISSSYKIIDGIEVTLDHLQSELNSFHNTEYNTNPRGRTILSEKLEAIGIPCYINKDTNQQCFKLNKSFMTNAVDDWKTKATSVNKQEVKPVMGIM